MINRTAITEETFKLNSHFINATEKPILTEIIPEECKNSFEQSNETITDHVFFKFV
jgi:hypothetical protein